MSVVVATRNRRAALARSLRMLAGLPERPEVIVVDNASADGTGELVATAFPRARLIRLRRNLGAAARNAGVRVARAPYVAFSDDDSWWEPGALGSAVRLFERHPRLGALAARTLVGPGGRADPVSRDQAGSPLPPRDDLPGPPILGFLACSAVVRRCAFLEVGGFSSVLFFGGEERLLAYDLAAGGWGIAYAGELTAWHFPSPSHDRAGRNALLRRNELMTAWMRRPLPIALARTGACAHEALRDPVARRALARAAARLPAALSHRRRLPPAVEAEARLIESGRRGRAGSVGAPGVSSGETGAQSGTLLLPGVRCRPPCSGRVVPGRGAGHCLSRLAARVTPGLHPLPHCQRSTRAIKGAKIICCGPSTRRPCRRARAYERRGPVAPAGGTVSTAASTRSTWCWTSRPSRPGRATSGAAHLRRYRAAVNPNQVHRVRGACGGFPDRPLPYPQLGRAATNLASASRASCSLTCPPGDRTMVHEGVFTGSRRG